MSRLLFPSAVGLMNNTDDKQVSDRFDEFKSFNPSLLSVDPAPIKRAASHVGSSSSSSWLSDEDVGRIRKREKEKKKKKSKKLKYERVLKPDTIWIDETKLQPENAFRLDKRADQQNIEFDALYRLDVATYREKATWLCLGLKKQYFNLYPHRKRKKKHKEDIRYFKNKDKLNEVTLAIDNRFRHEVESQDFLPLPQLSSTTNDPKIDTGEKNFSKLLQEHPHDVDLWVEFVKRQDDLFSQDEMKVSHNALIERKMSILEKALVQNPLSTVLILELMHLAKHIWPSEKLHLKWRELVFQFPNKTCIWREYLCFLQSDLIAMKVTKVLTAYSKCFRMLAGILRGTVRSHKPEPQAAEGLLSIFVQLVVFLWQAGYTEKSTSLLQCMIEYNFCSPSTFDDEAEKLKVFEEYFEKDTPRTGMSDCIHWCPSSTFPCIENTYSPANDFDSTLISLKHERKHDAWLELEKTRDLLQVLPFCGNHDDCDDTDRIVLFIDVSFCLFTLPSAELRFQLVLLYLFILGVSVPKHEFNALALTSISRFTLPTKSENSCFCHTETFCDDVSMSSVLFASKALVESTVRTVRNIFSQCLPLVCDNISRLSQIWLHFETTLFRWHFQNTERQLDKKHWKQLSRFIRSLLKLPANRGCIELWEMYAAYEWHLGNEDGARKIFATAVQLTSSAEHDGKVYCARVVRKMCELELDFTANEIPPSAKLLPLFLAFIHPENFTDLPKLPNAVDLLKISSFLKERFNLCITELNQPRFVGISSKVDFICCCVLFQYLFTGFDALKNAYSELLSLSGTVLKQLPEAFIYITFLARSHCVINYAHFPHYKQTVQKCLEIFPGNSFFNEMFVSLYQSGFGSLYARRFYKQLILSEAKNAETWLNAIEYEKKRLSRVSLVPSSKEIDIEYLEATSGVYNRVRSLYTHMLSESSTMHCSGVWFSLIGFHMKYGTKKQARDAFHTALRHCPAVKELYLLAYREDLVEQDQLFALMHEKEIRIKLIMEELDILLEN